MLEGDTMKKKSNAKPYKIYWNTTSSLKKKGLNKLYEHEVKKDIKYSIMNPEFAKGFSTLSDLKHYAKRRVSNRYKYKKPIMFIKL